MTVAPAVALTKDLRRLARLYGVQTEYLDAGKKRRQAKPEALIATLKALGAPLETEADIPSAIRERESTIQSRLIDPVVVAWDGVLPDLKIEARVTVTLEDGGNASNGASPRRLPLGYHSLVAERGGKRAEALVISAPKRAYTGEPAGARSWGTFVPPYALQSDTSWGSGDFSDLGRLAEWTAELGGSAVATLPLFAAFLDEPFQPSPYSPASRLFWNEFYLDVTAAPEFAASPDAQAIVASPDFQRELAELRNATEVAYKRTMALKRGVLEVLARRCFESSAREGKLRAFLRERPDAGEYARFRASIEQQGTPPPDDRTPESDDDAYRYHLYVQFLAHEQLAALRKSAVSRGVRLYFDLPLGVDPGGYDAWREREAFADGFSVGAPPDAFFTLGQDWGFAPPHPERAREQGYRYFRAVLENVLRYAGIVRIDHIMGLHRLYCIPQAMDARDGAYIRYPAEELYAILCLESHRHQAVIVGEDLGTVPSYVHEGMSQHAIQRTYVMQYELEADNPEPIAAPHRLSVASLNTHDMPPFAAYWQGLDIEDRLDLGLITEEQAEEERHERSLVRRAVVAELRRRGLLADEDPSTAEVLRGLLLTLARSRAQLALVNLEDLWLEDRTQNVPGTTDERVNWRRKARYTLEEMKSNDKFSSLLRQVDEMRKTRRDA